MMRMRCVGVTQFSLTPPRVARLFPPVARRDGVSRPIGGQFAHCPPDVSCSPPFRHQVEIDEYQNYEKALGALSEAAKCLGKVKGDAREERLAEVKAKATLVKQFVTAKK